MLADLLQDMKVDQKVSIHSISRGKLLIEKTGNLSEGVTDIVFLMVGVLLTAACDKFVEIICCCCIIHIIVWYVTPVWRVKQCPDKCCFKVWNRWQSLAVKFGLYGDSLLFPNQFSAPHTKHDVSCTFGHCHAGAIRHWYAGELLVNVSYQHFLCPQITVWTSMEDWCYRLITAELPQHCSFCIGHESQWWANTCPMLYISRLKFQRVWHSNKMDL